MTPTHHLDDTTLMAYAAGTLSAAFGVVASSHLSWCPSCRQRLRQSEALGGEMLTDIAPEGVSEACRNRTLAMLDSATIHRFPAAPSRPVAGEVPGALARLLPEPRLDLLAWKRKGPGVAMFDIKLPTPAAGKLTLLRIGAGRAMPEHGHGGEEITMVLKGAYHDHLGNFARGDVADLDEEIEHKPVASPGEDCVCLVATEAPTRFKSLAARLMQPFVGI